MNIYISNLGHQVTDESLRATFAAHGTVHATTIMMDTLTGRSRGFAYVSMPHTAEAAAAIQRINDSIIDGRKIRAEESIAPEEGTRADAGRYHPGE